MEWNSKLIKGKKANYVSYTILIIAMTVFGGMSFIKPIYSSVIDSSLAGQWFNDLYFHLFSFGFCLFSFGLGALGVSLIKLLPNLSKLQSTSFADEVEEHVILGAIVFLGAVLMLTLVLFQ